MSYGWQKLLYFASYALFILLGLYEGFTAFALHEFEGMGEYANYAYTLYRLDGAEQENPLSDYHPPLTHAQVIAERNRLNALYQRELWEGTYPIVIALLVLVVAIPIQRHLLIRREHEHSPLEVSIWQSSIHYASWVLFIVLGLCQLFLAHSLYTWEGVGRYENYSYAMKLTVLNEQSGVWNNYHPLTHEEANAQRAQLEALYQRELWDRTYPLVIALRILAVALPIQISLLILFIRRKRHHPPPTLAVQAS